VNDATEEWLDSTLPKNWIADQDTFQLLKPLGMKERPKVCGKPWYIFG